MKERPLKVYHLETEETSFDELLEFAKSNRARKLAHNTQLIVDVEKPEEGIGIQYHSTEIITFYSDGSIRLNTNGWQTSTTKARFNAFLPRRISVWQNLGSWYVTTPEGAFEFEDGMVIKLEGFTDAKVADVKADAREYRREKRAEKKASEAREAKWRADREARMVEFPVGAPVHFCLNLND